MSMEIKSISVVNHFCYSHSLSLSLTQILQSLLLLHYLINNGSERVVTNAREHIYDMKPLEEYTFRDENGRDQGVNG